MYTKFVEIFSQKVILIYAKFESIVYIVSVMCEEVMASVINFLYTHSMLVFYHAVLLRTVDITLYVGKFLMVPNSSE